MIEIGRNSFRVRGFEDLGTGVIYECFQVFGIFDCCKEALIMDVIGRDNSGANSLYKRTGRSSGVVERLGLRSWRRRQTS